MIGRSSGESTGGVGAAAGAKRRTDRRPGEKGKNNHAIGCSRGGRGTKIHALTDPLCRPVAFYLTGAHTRDLTTAAHVLARAPAVAALITDKAYDANDLRADLATKGATAVIPNGSRRKPLFPFDELAYPEPNVIERVFCRPKDFRRVATRYDKLPRNFLATVCSPSWWRIG